MTQTLLLFLVIKNYALLIIDYFKKLQHLIDETIENEVYIVTEDKTFEDLKLLRSFLYRNFKKYEHCEKMLPTSIRPGQLYGTTKIH